MEPQAKGLIGWNFEFCRSSFKFPSGMCVGVAFRTAQHHKGAGAEIAADIAGEVRWGVPTSLEGRFAVLKILGEVTALAR